MRLMLTLCFLSAASALRVADVEELPTVADVKHMIESAPQDIETQTSACSTLRNISNQGRDSEAQNLFSEKYIPTKFLEEGIGEVFAQAVLNILANKEATEKDIGDAANFCVNDIDVYRTLQVQNDAEKGLALYRNSPHLWDALIGFQKRFWKIHDPMGSCKVAGLFGTFNGSEAPASGFAKAGGVELVLEWLDEFHHRNGHDPDLLQNAMCALSDNVQSSKDVADKVLSLGGAKRLTETVSEIHSLPNHGTKRGNSYKTFGQWGTLHYQVLEVIIGMLKNDDSTRRNARAFIGAGLTDAVIRTMPDDPADFYFQDHCCQTLSWLANGNVAVQRELKDGKLAGELRSAVKANQDLDCKPNCYWPTGFDKFLGANDKVQPSPTCGFLGGNLGMESDIPPPWQMWYEARGHP